MSEAMIWVTVIVSIFLGVCAVGGLLMAFFYKVSR